MCIRDRWRIISTVRRNWSRCCYRAASRRSMMRSSRSLTWPTSPISARKRPRGWACLLYTSLERRAYHLAGGHYRAPAVTVNRFLAARTGLDLGRVSPSYALGVEAVDMDRLFPSVITRYLREGIRRFGQKLPGFDAPDAVLTGPETRTSSPVRILRDPQSCLALH